MKAKEAKGQEEEQEEREEQDDDDEEDEERPFSAEDMQDMDGETERELLFWRTFAALLPPEEGILSDFWQKKLGVIEREIRGLRRVYCTYKKYVFPSLFSFLIHLFLLVSLLCFF